MFIFAELKVDETLDKVEDDSFLYTDSEAKEFGSISKKNITC